MKNTPLISVIIPVYNTALYLPRCLDSICKQTYTHLEIIVVDDGSTDNSLEICQQYAKQEKRFIVLHQQNAGVSAARNRALEKTSGEFISFIDPDDWIAPDFYANFMSAYEQTKAPLIWGKSVLTPTTNPSFPKETPHTVLFNLEDFLVASFERNDFGTCNKFFHKSLLKHRFPKNQKRAEDWAFLFQAALQAHKIAYTNAPVYFYYQHAVSATHALDVTAQTQAFETFVNTYKTCQKISLPRATKAALSVAIGYASVLGLMSLLQTNNSLSQNPLQQVYAFLKEHFSAIWKNQTMGFPGKLFAWCFVKMPRLVIFGCRLPVVRNLLRKISQKRFVKSITLPHQHDLKIFNCCEGLVEIGGIESMLKNWYRQPNTGLWFDFALLKDTKADWTFVREVRSHGHLFLVNNMQRYSQCFKLITFYFRLYNILRKGNYDLFLRHQPSPFPLLLVHCWIAKLAGVKKIAILSHSALIPKTQSPWNKRIFRIIFPWCITHQLAVSQKAGQALFGQHSTFTLLHPAIEPEKFAFNKNQRDKLRKKLDLENKLVVGHVGRLSDEKNHAFLLQIFKQLHQLNPQARLLLVGDGPLRQTLEEQTLQLGLREFVLFEGNQPQTSAYYQAMDAFVFPSLAEGLPLVLLEAQASGLPCFVSDTVTPEAFVCNVTPLSLQATANTWAQTVLQTLEHFRRTDTSAKIQQAGFSTEASLQVLKNLCQHAK